MSKRKLVAVEAGTLFTPTKKFLPGRIIIEGQTIIEVGSADAVPIPAGADVVDATGLIVTPGFIDPHIHGCAGVDVMDGTYESLNLISRTLSRHGTTAFLPTTVSSAPEILTKAVEKLGRLMPKNFDGARPLGIHMEGPFISAAKRGTHKAQNVLAPDAKLLETWIRASENSIRLLTVAPELDGINPILRLAKNSGITVAMGHSNATLEQASAAAECRPPADSGSPSRQAPAIGCTPVPFSPSHSPNLGSSVRRKCERTPRFIRQPFST